jgi:hypothetical protein
LRPSDSGQNWKPRTREIPLLFSNDPKGYVRCLDHWQSAHHFAFDEPAPPSDFSQKWKPRTREIPLLFSNDPKGYFRCMGLQDIPRKSYPNSELLDRSWPFTRHSNTDLQRDSEKHKVFMFI